MMGGLWEVGGVQERQAGALYGRSYEGRELSDAIVQQTYFSVILTTNTTILF